MFSKFKRWVQVGVTTVGGATAGVLALAGSAHAAMPTGVTEALTDLQDNAVTIATTVLLAIIAIFAIKFIRKGL